MSGTTHSISQDGTLADSTLMAASLEPTSASAALLPAAFSAGEADAAGPSMTVPRPLGLTSSRLHVGGSTGWDLLGAATIDC